MLPVTTTLNIVQKHKSMYDYHINQTKQSASLNEGETKTELKWFVKYKGFFWREGTVQTIIL
jgi:hypothetical protein